MKKLTKKQIAAIHLACRIVDERLVDDPFSCNALKYASVDMRLEQKALSRDYERFFSPPKIGSLWGVAGGYLDYSRNHVDQRLLMLLLFAETKGQL
jgi:hypothetical protein